MDEYLLHEAATDFLMWCEYERRLSLNTVLAYAESTARLDEWIEGSLGRKPFVSDLTRTNLRRWMADLRSASASTAGRHLSAVKSMCRFLQDEGHLRKNPCMNLLGPKQKRKVPEILTVKQMAKVLDRLAKDDSPKGRRNHAIFELLYSSGMRVGELCALDVRDDRGEYVQIVEAKAGEGRLAIVNRSARKALDRWYKARKDLKLDYVPEAMFVNCHGKRYMRQSINQLWKVACEAAGVPRVKVHAIRHSCASHCVDAGMDVLDAATMLGHRSVSSTQIYIHSSPKRLRKGYAGNHPRAEYTSPT